MRQKRCQTRNFAAVYELGKVDNTKAERAACEQQRRGKNGFCAVAKAGLRRCAAVPHTDGKAHVLCRPLHSLATLHRGN